MPVGLETSMREAIPPLNIVKSMEVDYGKPYPNQKGSRKGSLKNG